MTEPNKEAELHLSQACRVMADLIQKYGPCSLTKSEFSPFQTLIRSIISQQISTKAANTILKRVSLAVPIVSPEAFLAAPPQILRAAGLSSSKMRYVLELSQRINDGRLKLDNIEKVPNEEVIAALTALPGIGKWTAEMFLIFGLGRSDVLPVGDAGLQRAILRLFGENVKLEEVARPWSPFRSMASLYLWKSLS